MSKTLSKILAAGFILVLIALAYWGYPILQNRYGKVPTPQNSTNTVQENPTPQENPAQNEPENVQGDAANNTPVSETAPFADVNRDDCLNGCKKFSKTPEIDYCKQACGLTKIQENPSDCTNKSGLDKDYCIKDLAIKNEDFKICEKISDKGIKETCTNRIAEDLLDKQLQDLRQL